MGALSQAFDVYRLHLRIMRANAIPYLLIGVLIPLGSYRLVALSWGNDAAVRILLGNVVFSAVLLVPRQGMNLVRLREFGQQRLLEAFGVQHRTALVANGFYILTMVPLCVAVALIGRRLGGVAPAASAGWVPPLLLTVVALAGVAYTISATSASPAAATMKSNLFIMASLAFCPLFYPLDQVPPSLQPLIGALPQTLCVEAMTAAWLGVPVALEAEVGLSMWAITLLALGVTLESRSQRRLHV